MMTKINSFYTQIKQYFTFSILPLFTLFISQIMLRSNGPFYSGANFDPSYVYLFNAINIVHRIPPGHYDHPGTPVQVFGAVIGLLRFSFQALLNRADTFYLDVLRNPEGYLRWFNFFMNLLLVFTLFVGGIIIYRLSKQWLKVFLFQITPFFYITTLQSTTQFTPEPFLLIVVLWLTILIYYQVKARPQKHIEYYIAIGIGVLIGLGIAIKITFLPLCLLVLFFKEFKKMILSAVALMLSFVVFTLPIVRQYVKFIDWIKDLLIHSGTYGGGEPGLPDFEKLVQNAKTLFFSEPAFFILLLVSLIFTFWICLKWDNRTKDKRLILLLLLINTVFVAQTLVTIKHPPIHYMQASLGLSGLLIIVISEITEKIDFGLKARRMSKAIAGLWLLFAIVFTQQSFISEKHRNVQYREEVSHNLGLIQNKYPGCTIAHYYRSSTPGYALSFGNDFVNDRFMDPLQQIYPDTLVYEKWEGNFHRFGEVLSSEAVLDLLEGGCLIVSGSPMEEETLASLAFSVLPIYEGRFEALYLVTSLQDDG